MKSLLLTAVVSFASGVGVVTAALLWKVGLHRESTKWVEPPDESTRNASSESATETTSYTESHSSEDAFTGVEVELIGNQDHWCVGYRIPGKGTIRPEVNRGPGGTTTVRIPTDMDVRLTLTSRDFVYLLALPRIHKTQIAIPGREFTLQFRSRGPGEFTLRGSHLCGPVKPALDLTMSVEPKPEFEAWLNEQERATERNR